MENKKAHVIRSGRNMILRERLVDKFWNNYDKELIAPILKEMDKKENWVVAKDITVANELQKIIELLKNEDLHDSTIVKSHNLDIFITLLAYMNSSWAFRVLKWLDDYRNPVLLKLTVSCSLNSKREEDEMNLTPSQLYIDRMLAIKNLSIIGEIFNKDRIASLSAFLDTYETSQFE